jgi:hypothetical protein
VSAPARNRHYVFTDAAQDAHRKAQAELGCAELLKRLIEHHPDLPVGICREPGTKRPLINYQSND